MKINANAKINLSLDVLDKRDDGYHNVCMIMQEIDLCDTLEVTLRDDGKIVLDCDGLDGTYNADNLAYRAARLFLDTIKSEKGCDISLKKKIPVGAGLGGGSADASAVLKALNILLGEPFNKEELKNLGLMLGADVPFCIEGGTAVSEGIGEILTPIYGMKPYWVALIKPKESISTKEAYHKIDNYSYKHPDVLKMAEYIKNGDMTSLFSLSGNVFEEVAKEAVPQIEKIKKHFYSYGALFSLMSGSGPTVYGLFDDEKKARNSLEKFAGDFEASHLSRILTK